MTEPPIVPRANDLSAVEIAKLEGRMDKGFAELNGRLDTMISEARAEREARRATADAQQKQLDDHEQRIRDNTEGIGEVRAIADKALTPGKAWAFVGGLGMLVVAAAGVVVNAVK